MEGTPNTAGLVDIENTGEFLAAAEVPQIIETTAPYEKEFQEKYTTMTNMSVLKREAADTLFQIASIKNTADNEKEFLITISENTRENLTAPFAVGVLESKLITIQNRIAELEKAEAADARYRAA